MIWAFILLIIAGSVGAVAYPLFRTKLQSYELPGTTKHDFSQADSWLSALSDLEDDLTLKRMSKSDYQQQKIFLQRGYLEWQNKSGNTKD
ncbi:MAG: hypothetical protein CL909_04070 [Deltaproteobacteria bacterium]|jgi:hypothetical protein|uniref:Uncharacterized protein n=1 Tax=marine metagenome TaxID=408172 RepID=A0A381NYU3_9ZZZZ|nr:hypothetical protein [Deltaproteobacteria bacterium]MDP6308950.1 hypothetical protein [SAR324 cluster bacterium]MDP6487729.1 hypothetical protein [SAR324 cluster bacterium]MDP7170411.1 hypothetical protein [SAR324 cluster bacterium]MDP7175299.1 hypothetical protein [SAR324 cluster bacterium]|tara:strand:- start:4141 stop:4410 length:270 start_codon:yes stop_codon:yes gene_type:complete